MASTYREEVALSDLSTDCRVITEAEPPYKIVHVNQAWCEASGHSASEMIGETCKERTFLFPESKVLSSSREFTAHIQ